MNYRELADFCPGSVKPGLFTRESHECNAREEGDAYKKEYARHVKKGPTAEQGISDERMVWQKTLVHSAKLRIKIRLIRRSRSEPLNLHYPLVRDTRESKGRILIVQQEIIYLHLTVNGEVFSVALYVT